MGLSLHRDGRDVKLVPPATVAAVAREALALRAELPPSRRGGTLVGIARARQLARRDNLSPRTIQRMLSFFARHEVDKQAVGFRKGEPGFPSKGRIAWDLWGGDAGRKWAEDTLKALQQQESNMIDVNVLTGADIRRIDGKFGKISKVSMPWVTVQWENGERQSFLRSDDALSEDIELKTLDKGWVSLGSVVGVTQAEESSKNNGDALSEADDSKPTSELLAETRLLKRRMLMSEAAKKRKSKAASKIKEKLKAKKKKKASGGVGDKKHSPYKRLSKRGQPPENAPKYTGNTDNFFGNPDLKVMPAKNKWSCSKAGKYHQVCTHVDTGETKHIYIDKAYKKSYNAGYAAATRAGETNAAAAKK